MSHVYISHGYTIRPLLLSLEKDDKTIQVRPKTFALLLAFLQKPQELLTKEALLTSVWDDVVVDEQVLVQSIRELRQLFGDSEVIKTHPRKGYVWVPHVEKQPAENENGLLTVAAETSSTSKSAMKAVLFITFTLLVISTAVIVALNSKDRALSTHNSFEGTILVLPTKIESSGEDARKNELATMDRLIRLVNSKTNPVMDTLYVLTALDHANLQREFKTEQVRRLFEVTGAGLIVETTLTGSVGEYRLDYKLHFRNDIKQGVVFGQRLDDVEIKLVQNLSNYTGLQTSKETSNADSEFNNELLARALTFLDKKLPDQAIDLLSSVIALEPANKIAYQLIAEAYIQNHQPIGAEKILLSFFDRNVEQKKDSPRLYYWLAQAQFDQGKKEEAFVNLDKAQDVVKHQNDWLYLAYVAELRGQILSQDQKDVEAETAYKEALNYHSVIQCPIGIANIQLQLVNLYNKQTRYSEAKNFLNQASYLIETHHLDHLKPALQSLQLSVPKS